MQIEQSPYKRQANAKSTLRPLQRTINLRKHLENAGQHIAGNTDAVVSNTDDGITPFTICGEPDVTAPFRVLGSVIQQIQEDLSEPDGIGVEIERLWRQANSEFLTALVDKGTAAFDSTFQNRCQHNTLFSDVQLVATKTGPETGDGERCVQRVDGAS